MELFLLSKIYRYVPVAVIGQLAYMWVNFEVFILTGIMEDRADLDDHYKRTDNQPKISQAQHCSNTRSHEGKHQNL